MIKRIFTLCLSLTASVASITAATVTINSYNFPDVKFRAYLKTADFNSNGDNELTDAEIKNATMLEVNEKGITNLKGIEFFTSMWLLDCSDNDLQSLDVSKNTALTMLACANNKLKSLDVSKNTNLGFLACYGNQLTSLDLSKNTALSELDCFLNQIKGESMDALIASLPQGTNCEFVAVSDGDLELNVCTGPQAKAAKQKGWNLSCWYCNSFVDNPFEGGVTINAYNFPDIAFRSQVLTYDTDVDGMLADKDIQAVKILKLNSKGIKDLTGIEYFTALTELYCQWNSLESLDVSKNTALTYLDCSANSLKSLDVSKNTALTYFDCESTSLKSLDVSKNTALIELNCSFNRLESLDVSKNTALTNLNCFGNGLENLDVSKNMALEELYCGRSNLKSLVVSKNMALKVLYCYGNQIKGSNMGNLVNNLPDMQGTLVVCEDGATKDNVISRAQVKVATGKGWKVQKYTKDENDKWVYVDYAGVSVEIPIDATNFPDEKFRNYLLSQDYGKDAKLTEEEIEGITELKVGMKSIEDLTGIEHFTALTVLWCHWNKIKSLDISKNTALKALYCYHNSLKSLDVSKNTALKVLDCSGNSLYSLDVSKNTALIKLYCYYNDNLSSLDVSKNTALTELRCGDQSLKSLDVSKNTALTSLFCGDSGLRSLDVSNNTALRELYCERNSLISLDVSKCTALERLECYVNCLTSLDVSKNTALTGLVCYGNNIKGTSMDNLVKSLPKVEDGLFDVVAEYHFPDNNITAAQVKVATDKGWKVYKDYGNGYEAYAGLGDVNNDNKINQDDLDLLVQIVMGQQPAYVDVLSGDLNNDGKVDAADIVTLVNILNGK